VTLTGQLNVSAVLTVRNEPLWRLERVIEGLSAQTVVPVELLIAAPPEESAAWARRVATWPAWVRLIPNPSGTRSEGLNRAIRQARGEIVCRVDARSLLPPDYVASCGRRLVRDRSIGVVGGVQRPVAADGVLAAGIARALRNRFALGGARYRSVGSAGPVDTVYLGTWRRCELLALGGFDERLDANEDFDLCQRIRAAGSTVWLEDGLVVGYEPRRGLRAVWRQYAAFGRAKVRFWRVTGQRPNGRQLAAMVCGGAAAVATAVMVGQAHSRQVLAVAVAMSVGLLTLDHTGSDANAKLGERAIAAGTFPVVWTAWLAGIATGVLTEHQRR
jgi:hypothetical protein